VTVGRTLDLGRIHHGQPRQKATQIKVPNEWETNGQEKNSVFAKLFFYLRKQNVDDQRQQIDPFFQIALIPFHCLRGSFWPDGEQRVSFWKEKGVRTAQTIDV
jgi:hypothetical protein